MILKYIAFSCVISLCLCVSRDSKITLNDGNTIPAPAHIAFGTWLGNSSNGRIDPQYNETEQAVLWALDAGYRHIDTAFSYSVEDQVGRALKRKFEAGLTRQEVFVTTKLWNTFHARAAVVPALRESLKQLDLEYVDLYLIHWPTGQFEDKSFDPTDYVETWRGMIDAKAAGLTKSIGVSNFNESQMNRLMTAGLEVPAVLQLELNLNLQQPSLLSYCQSHNILVMGYTPFGSLVPSKRTNDSIQPKIDSKELVEIAERYNKTVPQIALRYLVELGVVPIPKSLKKNRIEENIGIFDITLSEEDRKLLKSYDKNYRTIPQLKWKDHVYYPFEKTSE